MAKVNAWLLINLGCEMLYIIDQRLNAQNIDKDKAAKVLRDVTNSLLSPNFFSYIATTFSDEVMSLSQARILLTDIACCSLMRLDPHSLDKLIDLMIMIFKWQLFLISMPDELLSITMRHLQGIGRLMAEKAKFIIIDQANQYLFSSWKEYDEEEKYTIVRKLNKFLSPHTVRISLLIRFRLQQRDGSFVDKLSASSNDFYKYYTKNIGENIYEKVGHFPHCQVKIDKSESSRQIATQEIDFLFQQFKGDHEQEEMREEKTNELAIATTTTVVEEKNTLDELKKKCKLDMIASTQDAPDDDNFQELLNMLGKQ